MGKNPIGTSGGGGGPKAIILHKKIGAHKEKGPTGGEGRLPGSETISEEGRDLTQQEEEPFTDRERRAKGGDTGLKKLEETTGRFGGNSRGGPLPGDRNKNGPFVEQGYGAFPTCGKNRARGRKGRCRLPRKGAQKRLARVIRNPPRRRKKKPGSIAAGEKKSAFWRHPNASKTAIGVKDLGVMMEDGVKPPQRKGKVWARSWLRPIAGENQGKEWTAGCS